MAEWSQNLPGYYRVVVWLGTPASQKIFDPRLLQQERKKERKKEGLGSNPQPGEQFYSPELKKSHPRMG